MKINRKLIVGLSASLAAITSIAMFEGFRATPYIPVPGDVWTQGYGTTKGVTKNSAPITKREALDLLKTDVKNVYEAHVKRCVKQPLTQYEYDAYVSLTYNIGGGAFCRSTIVKNLNKGNYVKACESILKWDYYKGKRLKGLTERRKREYAMCKGVGYVVA